MRTSVLAYDVDGVRQLADAWNRAGFTAPYLAVDLRQMPGETEDADHAWTATLLRGGVSDDVDGTVAGLLSDLRPDYIVLACIRSTDGSQGLPEAMVHLLEHIQIRASDAVREVRVEGLDIVFPQRPDMTGPVTTTRELAGFAVPACPQGFRRVIVSPEDSKAPGEPDVGVDSAKCEAVSLHAALASVGVVGGYWAEADLALGADLDQPILVRAHSRVVAGGKVSFEQAARFTTHELFSVTRGDCEPTRYREVSGDESESLQAGAIRAFRMRWREIVTHAADPLPPWSPAAALSLWEHITRLFGFLPWAIGVVIRGSGQSARALVQKFNSTLESDDQGYSIGPQFSVSAGEWWTWLAVDEVNAINSRVEVADEERRAAGPINPSVWRDLTQLAMGLCDGSPLPFPVPEAEYEGRQLLLRGGDVAEDIRVGRVKPMIKGVPPTPESGEHGRGSGTKLHDAQPDWQALIKAPIARELSQAEPIRPEVLARARQWATGGQQEAIAGAYGPGNSKVVRQAKTLAEQEAREGKNLDAARDELLRTDQEASPPTLLGQLRSRTLADLLVATSDAERWKSEATRPSLIQPEILEKAVTRYRRIVRLLALVTVILGIIWWNYGVDATRWFNQNAGTQVTPLQVAGVLATIIFVIFFLLTVRLYRVYMAEAEKARRHVEGRSRARAAARSAFRERNRLRAVDRVMALWIEVLSWSIAGGVADEATFDSRLDDASTTNRPVAMQVALPVQGEIQLRRMGRSLTSAATEPGWRLQWLDALIEATGILPSSGWHRDQVGSSKSLTHRFLDDDGRGNTPLRELSGAVGDLAPRSEVTARWISRLDEALAVSYFADERCPIDVPYVALRLPSTEWGSWFEPLRSNSTFRHVLSHTSHEGAADRLSHMAGFPRVVALPEHGRHVQVQPRSPGVTAVQVRLEAVLLNTTSLKLVEAVEKHPGKRREGREGVY